MPSNRKRWFLVAGLCALFLLPTILLSASYLCARAQADALIAKIPRRLAPYSSRFCFVQSISGRWGPCWDFAYDSNDFGVGPLTLTVTLTGEVVASNPASLLAKLRALP